MGAQFKVIKIDPDGSGANFKNHLGHVFEGQRCCKNCTIIYAMDGNFGPFVPGELEPLNDEAKVVQAEIEAFDKARRTP